MFLKANEDKGLNVYIELMLKSLAPPKPCAQQRTILVTWLLQRYLSLSSNPPDRIRNFLDKHVEILDLSTTMSMLASSGEMDLFLFYAERVEAWDRVCAFLNRVGDTKRLLTTLTSLSMNLSEQMLYEYVINVLRVCHEILYIFFSNTQILRYAGPKRNRSNDSILDDERKLVESRKIVGKCVECVSQTCSKRVESRLEVDGEYVVSL